MLPILEIATALHNHSELFGTYNIRLKKNETQSMYCLKYLLHRKITVEELHTCSRSVQNLAILDPEFGHIIVYYKLPQFA